MNLFKTVLSYLILFFLFSVVEAGDIKGKVKYDGKPPKKKPLRMDADPVCGSSHSGKVFAESFKVNGKGIEYKFPRIFTFRISTKGLTLLIAKIIVGKGEKPREEISRSNFSNNFSALTFSPFFMNCKMNFLYTNF